MRNLVEYLKAGMSALRADELSRIAAVICIGIIATTWSVIHFDLRHEERSITAARERDLARLAQAFAEHVKRTLDGADQTLRFVRRQYLLQGHQVPLADYVGDSNVINELYKQIAIIRADGRVDASSVPTPRADLLKVDLSDRPHFKFHLQTEEDIPRVGEPLVGRVSKQPSIQVTRRVFGNDGSFQGVVVVSLSPEYFTSFYRTFELGESSGITLLGRDGIVRARISGAEASFGQNLSGSNAIKNATANPHGIYRGISQIDGVDRVSAYRNVPEYNLIVFVTLKRQVIDDDVAALAEGYNVAGGAITLVTLTATMLLIWVSQRRRRLVATLRQREFELTQANTAQKRLIASVSHELRTPLTSIMGYSGLLRDTVVEPELKEYAEIIETSSQHLRDIVNGILDYSMLEAGKLELRPEAVDLRALVERALKLYQVMAVEKGLELRLELAGELPAQVMVDSTKLLQVLTNLLLNAVKFTQKGGITVRVSGRQNTYAVEVIDTGIGISAETQADMFQPFQQVKDEGHQEGRGAGLGLALVKELVQAMGGSIYVESEVGKGTRFTVELPVDRVVANRAGEKVS